MSQQRSLYLRARKRRARKAYIIRMAWITLFVVLAAIALGFVSTVEYFHQ